MNLISVVELRFLSVKQDFITILMMPNLVIRNIAWLFVPKSTMITYLHLDLYITATGKENFSWKIDCFLK